LVVYGDCAYGAGSLLDTLERGDARIMCKVQPPVAPAGRFAKDAFTIDLQAATVTCPAGQTTALRTLTDGQIAYFGAACRDCRLGREQRLSPATARRRPTQRRTTANGASARIAAAPAPPCRDGSPYSQTISSAPETPIHTSLLEHHRPVLVDQHPVLEVPAHRA